MTCNIVLHPNCRGWIIEKMAVRLAAALVKLGVDAAVSPAFSDEADINHFMIFHYVEGARAGHHTMLITHVDDALKLRMIKDALSVIEVGICMSRMTLNSLVAQGIPRSKLCFVAPAHDSQVVPRRIVIGITSNLPADGRKREFLLARLAREMDLSDFQFEVFGRGWERTAEQLRSGGAVVDLHEPSENYDADYALICRQVPLFDYYFYMGMDEGSLGTLDALAAGIPTVITPQGFHLDIPNGITHSFVEFDQMRKIFEDLAKPRRDRVAAAARLTWVDHAQNHLRIWEAMLGGQVQNLPRILNQEDGQGSPLSVPSHDSLFTRVGNYAKLGNRYRWNMLKRYYAPKVRRRWEGMKKKIGLK